ncbi:hypothetical protein C8Q77DRAFT_1087885 [Trametes polyzona]|nr:hypothetical protein C8Q77DRAFT_1087885 [Trametes polyzona]
MRCRMNAVSLRCGARTPRPGTCTGADAGRCGARQAAGEKVGTAKAGGGSRRSLHEHACGRAWGRERTVLWSADGGGSVRTERRDGSG